MWDDCRCEVDCPVRHSCSVSDRAGEETRTIGSLLRGLVGRVTSVEDTTGALDGDTTGALDEDATGALSEDTPDAMEVGAFGSDAAAEAAILTR